MATKESLAEKTVPVGECLFWTGHIARSGYGLVWHGGKNQSVHRVAYELHNGQIPDGLHVMHKCDNRPCINPAHLKAATRYENMMDMFLKDRHRVPSGVDHANAKITPEIAAEIRRRYVYHDRKNGSSALAREFGVTQSTVYCVLQGKTWKEAAS